MAAVVGMGLVRAGGTPLVAVVTALILISSRVVSMSGRLVARNDVGLTFVQRLGSGVVVMGGVMLVGRGIVCHLLVPAVLIVCHQQLLPIPPFQTYYGATTSVPSIPASL